MILVSQRAIKWQGWDLSDSKVRVLPFSMLPILGVSRTALHSHTHTDMHIHTHWASGAQPWTVT